MMKMANEKLQRMKCSEDSDRGFAFGFNHAKRKIEQEVLPLLTSRIIDLEAERDEIEARYEEAIAAQGQSLSFREQLICAALSGTALATLSADSVGTNAILIANSVLKILGEDE